MWQALFEIVPKPAILAIAIYAAISWFVTGPLVAQRTAAIHHYPVCVAGLAMSGESAADQLLDNLKRSPLLQNPLMHQLGLERYFDLIQQERQAQRAGRSEPRHRCACLIVHAIDRSQTAWAVHAGSLRLIAWAEVARFDSIMARVEKEGLCHG